MGFCIKATPTNRWPKGAVPYQIDATVFLVGSAGRQQVILAINGWNTTSIVKLVPFVATNTDFVLITKSADATACSSPLGKQGGQQLVACNANAAAGVIMHEIGHALGLIHEHKRPDRNTFITVNNSNIALGKTGQFSPIDLTNCPVGPDDCGSIMHYGVTSFSVDGLKQTITVKNPVVCSNIGRRNLLSAGDLAAARVMYDSIITLSNKVTLSDTSDFGPTLVFHDNALFLAWRGSGNDNLNVSVSDDRGVSFHGKHASPETSDDAPTLASHLGRLFIAYKGSRNDNINVAVVNQTGTQHEIAMDVGRLLGIAQATNPAAALELQRLEKLQQEIEKCCPPDMPPPLCEHAPCPQPPQFRERPPSVDYRPIPEPTPLRNTEG